MLQNPWSAGTLAERSVPPRQGTGVLLQAPPTVSVPPSPGMHSRAAPASRDEHCYCRSLFAPGTLAHQQSQPMPCEHIWEVSQQHPPPSSSMHPCLPTSQLLAAPDSHLPALSPWLLEHWKRCESKITSSMFVITYLPDSPKRAPTEFYNHAPDWGLLVPKGTGETEGEEVSGSTRRRTQVSHFQTNTLPNSSLSIFKSTDPNT